MSHQGLKDLQHGEFGADMKIVFVNDGPVTIVIDTDEHPLRGCNYETLSKMKTAFTPDGVTTAANASGI